MKGGVAWYDRGCMCTNCLHPILQQSTCGRIGFRGEIILHDNGHVVTQRRSATSTAVAYDTLRDIPPDDILSKERAGQHQAKFSKQVLGRGVAKTRSLPDQYQSQIGYLYTFFFCRDRNGLRKPSRFGQGTPVTRP